MLDALRLGTHQLLAMRVPAHAAISTTVDLVRQVSNQGAAGFANAVLRKVSADDLDGWVATLAERRERPRPACRDRPQPSRRGSSASCGARWPPSTPPTSSTPLLAADNEPPRVTLVARPGRSEVAELPGTPTLLSPYGVVLDGGNPSAVPAVADGRAGVQDEGSQLVALALAAAEVVDDAGAWLDLCAGPGGKAALLAALAAERGGSLTALELQEHRAGLVARALAGTPAAGRVVAGRRRPTPLRPASFDRVLVDAPCTGLGALRRRPEARWRRRPEDLVTLVLLQRALLNSALDLTRPGGVVLYATCSPVLAETVRVVGSVAEARDDVAVEDAAALLPAAHRRRRPAPRHPPALAPPPRHRRDVHRAAAPHRLTPRDRGSGGRETFRATEPHSLTAARTPHAARTAVPSPTPAFHPTTVAPWPRSPRRSRSRSTTGWCG